MTSTYFLSGGGTAGHVNPALAIGRALLDAEPDAKLFYFVSHDGMEKEMVSKAGFETIEISADIFPVKKRDWPRFLRRTIGGIFRTLKMIRRYRPRAVIGTGGYVAAPMIFAAKMSKVPIILHEQNAYPGRANRYLSKSAKAVCMSFPGTEVHFAKKVQKRCTVTGNPINRRFFEADKAWCREQLDLSDRTELIVVMGGSLGARSINEAVEKLFDLPAWKAFEDRHPYCLICLSSGKVNTRFLTKKGEQNPRLIVKDYILSPVWMPAADLLVGRAGAGFLAETAASAKASVIIPFPQAIEDHQTLNAQVFEKHGAAVCIKDSEFNAEALLKALTQLLENPELRERMERAAADLAKPNAARDIAAIVRGVSGGRYEA